MSEHGDESMSNKRIVKILAEQESALCCHAHWNRWVDALPDDTPFSLRLLPRMILCPECGNKRCPKASDCTNGCTRSNEPGQAGSVYVEVSR